MKNLLAGAGAFALLSSPLLAQVPPTVTKAFSPATIVPGEQSSVVITFSNVGNGTPTTLTAPFSDTLPDGIAMAPVLNVSNTCAGTAMVGLSSVGLLDGVTLPANGTCQLSVDVTVAEPGDYVNIILAGALQTTVGSNVQPASATLAVVTPVPTMAEWMLVALAGLLGAAGWSALRRRATRAGIAG